MNEETVACSLETTFAIAEQQFTGFGVAGALDSRRSERAATQLVSLSK